MRLKVTIGGIGSVKIKKIMTKDLILNILKDKSIKYLFLVSLISSDNILSIEDAEKALALIDDVESAINEGDVSDDIKKEVEKYIINGRKILKQDIERFNNGKIKI